MRLRQALVAWGLFVVCAGGMAPAQAERLADGTAVHVRLTKDLLSSRATVGSRVDLEIAQPVLLHGVVAIPPGSVAWGTVQAAKKGKTLEFDIEGLRLPNQQIVKLRVSAAKTKNAGKNEIKVTTRVGGDLGAAKGSEFIAYLNQNVDVEGAGAAALPTPVGASESATQPTEPPPPEVTEPVAVAPTVAPMLPTVAPTPETVAPSTPEPETPTEPPAPPEVVAVPTPVAPATPQPETPTEPPAPAPPVVTPAPATVAPATPQLETPTEPPAPAPPAVAPAPATVAPVVRLTNGTAVRVRLTKDLLSSRAAVGARVDMEIAQPVSLRGVVVIPPGSVAWGTVEAAKKGKTLRFNINGIRLPNQQIVKLRVSAVKSTNPGKHEINVITRVGSDLGAAKGSEFVAYLNQDVNLEAAMVSAAPPAPVATPQNTTKPAEPPPAAVVAPVAAPPAVAPAPETVAPPTPQPETPTESPAPVTAPPAVLPAPPIVAPPAAPQGETPSAPPTPVPAPPAVAPTPAVVAPATPQPETRTESPAPVAASPVITPQTAPPAVPALPTVQPTEHITVECFSVPSGADIMIDGEFHGTTPSILKLPPGKHQIEFRLQGYNPHAEPLNLAAGAGLHTLRMTLEKRP